jgi:hypothetical protein
MKHTTRTIIVSASLLFGTMLLSGCAASKRVSGSYGSLPTHAQGLIQPTDVRTYHSIKEIKEPYCVLGSLSAEVIYMAKMTETSNTGPEEAARHESMLRQTAARAGANSLVGLTTLRHPVRHEIQSICLIASTGGQSGVAPTPRPKSVVCMLPLKVRTRSLDSSKYNEHDLEDELRYYMARKGYYTYKCDSILMSGKMLVEARELPAELAQPLGFAPDFALDVDISDHPEVGPEILILRVALYDLTDKTLVWEARIQRDALSLKQAGFFEAGTLPLIKNLPAVKDFRRLN